MTLSDPLLTRSLGRLCQCSQRLRGMCVRYKLSRLCSVVFWSARCLRGFGLSIGRRHRLGRDSDVSRRTVHPDNAASNLAVIQALPQPYPGKLECNIGPTTVFLHLLSDPAAIPLDPVSYIANDEALLILSVCTSCVTCS